MTMPYHIQIAHSLSHKDSVIIEQLIADIFNHVNTTFNHWNPDSELSRINQLKSYEALLISKDIKNLCSLSNELHFLSKGLFDPTLRPLIQSLKNQTPFPVTTIGWRHIELRGSILTKSQDHVELDFDAISKGYAIDLIADRFVQAGYPNIYVEWGGEIKALGTKCDGSPWRISIRNPLSPYLEDAIATICLSNSAIATSGDYLQHWNINGEEVTHIINGNTLKPKQITPSSIASVAVKAATCALADGLATIAMLYDEPEELNAWIKYIKSIDPDIEFWVMWHSIEKKPHSLCKKSSDST